MGIPPYFTCHFKKMGLPNSFYRLLICIQNQLMLTCYQSSWKMVRNRVFTFVFAPCAWAHRWGETFWFGTRTFLHQLYFIPYQLAVASLTSAYRCIYSIIYSECHALIGNIMFEWSCAYLRRLHLSLASCKPKSLIGLLYVLFKLINASQCVFQHLFTSLTF